VSKTKYIKYANSGFWAYDVTLSVFLKHLIDAAEASDEARTERLSRDISFWRVVACIPDYGLSLDARWPDMQRQNFIALAEVACSLLTEKTSIPAAEIAAWPLFDDMHIFPRGATEVRTAPVVELGRAIIALISGTLPEAPSGMAWFYTDTGRETLRMASLPLPSGVP
jgi:hypothetical protein